MAIYEYQNLTHLELSELPREKTTVFIPVGPLEQHGPHLPLGVDAFSAAYFSRKMAEKLSEKSPDWNFILFPTIFAGCDTLTYTGTIEVRPSIIRALLYDCCKQLAKDGFKSLIAVGAHGGPRHIVVLEEVAAKMRWRHRARMISASGKILSEVLEGGFIEKIAEHMQRNGEELTKEEREGLKKDYHGGLLETSLMMVAKPELVKSSYKELKPAILEDLWKLRRNSGKKIGDGLGHLGSPALARPEIGVAATEVIVEDIEPLLREFLDGKNVYHKFRSKFYYIPLFRTHFKFMVFIAIYIILFAFAFWLLNYYLMEMVQ